MSVTLYIFDFVLLLYQMTYSSPQQIICGVVIIFVTAIVMNHIITLGRSSLQLMIVSEKYEQLKEMFLHDLNRGVTLFSTEGGYLQEQNKTILSIVSRKDLYLIQNKIYEVDPSAFLVVSTVKEVHGEGFKPLYKKTLLK